MDISIFNIETIDQARKFIRDIGPDEYSVNLMAFKSVTRAIYVKDIDNRAANLIKQEMLSIGGETVLNKKVCGFAKGKSNVLITGTIRQFEILLSKLKNQPFGLKEYAFKIEKAISNYFINSYELRCKSKKLELGEKPTIMGILNVTQDSFYDGGNFFNIDKAIKHALDMVSKGAGIIDVGGESTRPGAMPITAKEEISRVVPVIKSLTKKINIPISIDTYKPEVAKASLDSGASIINDITGLRYKNGLMARLVSRSKVPVIIMHMRKNPKTMQNKPKYKNVIFDILDFFEERINFVLSTGITHQQIIIDPGIGFGKNLEHNIEILKRLREFKVLGSPIAIGTSRKSFIGHILGEAVPSQRLFGSVASFVWAAINGANIIRVHDVSETMQALNVIESIRGI